MMFTCKANICKINAHNAGHHTHTYALTFFQKLRETNIISLSYGSRFAECFEYICQKEFDCECRRCLLYSIFQHFFFYLFFFQMLFAVLPR